MSISLCVRRAFLLLILCVSLSSVANAAGMVVIDSPETIGVGKPLLVNVTSWYPMDDVRVTWAGREVAPSIYESEGKHHAVVFLGIGLRGELGVYPVDVTVSIWGKNYHFSKSVSVVESTWGHETLTVPPKMVKPPKKALERIARERERIMAALNTVSPERYWTLPFSRPTKGKMLSRFGLHRIFNGDTASRHTGLDFRAWEGTPLYAMAAGKVILKGHFYYAGNCIYVDHGNGFISMYAHMSKVLVNEGDMLTAGQKIGLSGATGRVNGAHLHLGTFMQGQVVDPEPLFAMEADALPYEETSFHGAENGKRDI
ncbi:peptidoglycan DD-metalloendopeptidase family protein [Pseudodesulfovibrio sp. JC047]|uniref:M23 family metallopeptidase n=1 Tax=Pseudodesulfovibrio sp. JC047 TaxID=2683199 RepID=UPI0013CFB3CC|nr:M23 family metallopeptidase [Pseudodesulfovibrio sp. JC047]NDV20790.1 peptidoglycan DD-metalloendopeptidase family protein [Pseudodesulfovibrio sp. JC047]